MKASIAVEGILCLTFAIICIAGTTLMSNFLFPPRPQPEHFEAGYALLFVPLVFAASVAIFLSISNRMKDISRKWGARDSTKVFLAICFSHWLIAATLGIHAYFIPDSALIMSRSMHYGGMLSLISIPFAVVGVVGALFYRNSILEHRLTTATANAPPKEHQ